MAYDASRKKVLLFGGYDGIDYFGDTWTRAGSAWTEQAPATSPSKRSSMGMAYDAARAEVVLFGGAIGASTFADTWTWDGTTWTRRALDTP
jgi:hypothetical protein